MESGRINVVRLRNIAEGVDEWLLEKSVHVQHRVAGRKATEVPQDRPLSSDKGKNQRGQNSNHEPREGDHVTVLASIDNGRIVGDICEEGECLKIVEHRLERRVEHSSVAIFL